VGSERQLLDQLFERQVLLQISIQALFAHKSLYARLIDEATLYSRDMYHRYLLEEGDVGKVFQVAIVDFETFLKRCLRESDLTALLDYPYLYIAYNEYTNDVIPIELSNEEAYLIQVIFAKTSITPHITLTELSDDKAMQQTVGQVFGAMIQRMQHLSIPAIRDGYLLSLPLPAAHTDLYPEQIKWLIDKNTGSERRVVPKRMMPKFNRGDVAKRLRSLGMIAHKGSIQGVYTSSKQQEEWVTLNTLELALHEDRYISGARLTLNEIQHTILICWMDAKESPSGLVFILSDGQSSIEQAINKQYQIGECKVFEGEIQNHVVDLDLLDLGRADLVRYYDQWFDNLRVPEFLSIWFEVMEAQNISIHEVVSFINQFYA